MNKMRSTKRWLTASRMTAIATSSPSARSRSDRTELGQLCRECRKTLRYGPIYIAPERHHEIGDAVEPFPSPLVEFRRLAVTRRQRIDFIVAPGKAQREPLLALA